MKRPVPPPAYGDLLARILERPDGAIRLATLMSPALGPAPAGRYRHWDTFRHAPPIPGVSADEQWLAVKTARRALYRPLPLTDVQGEPFQYAIPAPMLAYLHRIDRDAAGHLAGAYVGGAQVTDPATRDAYLFASVAEEAITSSQLEGASTTRKVAKAMLQEGRAPMTRSEQMIANNYEAMQFVRRHVADALTPAMVFELQRILTAGALDDPTGAGRFRRDDEEIVIEDEQGTRLHTPPPAPTLPDRLEAMCAFANGTSHDEFIPPVVRAILLHFWLAYDHPFIDGNGRTARALFYWAMARAGYWLCEYVSISRILRKARGRYARSYLYVETDDRDTTYFLLSQMRVLLQAIDDLQEYLRRKARDLEATQQRFRRLARDSRLNPRQLALVQHALTHSDAEYTVASHQRSHGVVYETARSDLLALVRRRWLVKRQHGRKFVFGPAPDLAARLAG
jgi:Fic family protein